MLFHAGIANFGPLKKRIAPHLRRLDAVDARGTAAPTPRYTQVPLGARVPRACARRGLQPGVRQSAPTFADASAGQEVVQNRNPASGHLLHRILESRARRLNIEHVLHVCLQYVTLPFPCAFQFASNRQAFNQRVCLMYSSQIC